MSEQQSLRHFQSKVFCRNFLGLWLLKHSKIPYLLQTVTFKLSLKGKKTNLGKEKPKVSYFVALVVAFIAAENENRQMEDLL